MLAFTACGVFANIVVGLKAITRIATINFVNVRARINMDIKNALEAYLQELNDIPQTEYKVASKIANLSIKVEELVKSIDEFESEGL